MQNNFEKEQERLKKAINELAALNKISNAINALMSVEEITKIVIDLCIKRIKALQGVVFLIDEQDEEIDKFKTFIREYDPESDKIPFHIGDSISGWMIKNKTILVCNDTDTDEKFRFMNLKEAGIKSILSAPLLSGSGLIGSLILFNKSDPDGFTEDDKRFLGIVGAQVAKVIDNARLREQESKLKIIQQEMEVAHSIQKRFLPAEGIHLELCDVCGINISAKDVGGDYYDIVQLDEHRIFISIGDVSGKGMPAALLMANAQAVLRSQLPKTANIILPELAQSLNYLIYQFTSPEQFITALFGVFDTDNKTFQYINAGHEPPIVIHKNGNLEIFNPADLVIGVLPEVNYSINEIKLQRGDVLFACTDGITEAYNEYAEQFGEKRLHEFLNKYYHLNSSEICNEIINTLASFRGKAIQSDDITSIILNIKND